MRDVNMDLEDWMVMEAIRLSLAEQEENERKKALKKSKEEAKNNNDNSTSTPVQLFDQTAANSSTERPSSSTSPS
jgi:hypothetical protein